MAARPARRVSWAERHPTGRRERHVRRARAPLRERLRRAEHDARATDEPPRSPARSPCELDVGSPELEHERLPRLHSGQRRGEPVRVDEIRVTRSSSCGTRVRREEQRHEERLPRTALQIPDDAVPVGEPEVPKRGGRDDLDLDPCRPQVLDRVANERSRDVVRPARVRRRENDDLHSRCARATTGSAAASVAKT